MQIYQRQLPETTMLPQSAKKATDAVMQSDNVQPGAASINLLDCHGGDTNIQLNSKTGALPTTGLLPVCDIIDESTKSSAVKQGKNAQDLTTALEKLAAEGNDGRETVVALANQKKLTQDTDLLAKLRAMGNANEMEGLKTLRLLSTDAQNSDRRPVSSNLSLSADQRETVDNLLATFDKVSKNGTFSTQTLTNIWQTSEADKEIDQKSGQTGFSTGEAKALQKLVEQLDKDSQKLNEQASTPTQLSDKSQTVESNAQKEQARPEAQTPPPVVSSGDFASRAEALFDKLDKNHTGHLSKEDLAKAIEDPQYKGQDAQVLAAMYENYDKLRCLSNTRVVGPDELTKMDLENYGHLEQKCSKESETPAKMYYMANDASFLKQVNPTGAQYITKQGLETALKSNTLSADQREVAQYMYDNFGSIENANGDRTMWNEKGISTTDMVSFYTKLWSQSDFETVNYVNCTLNNTHESQVNGCQSLYGDQADPLSSITPDAIQQGNLGDCYFEAALASLAQTNPQIIKDMIKDNGNGTYTVTFPGNKNEPITVTAPTEAEQGIYNKDVHNGLWACVMEKAYGKYCQKHFWRRSPLNIGGGLTPTEGADGGGQGDALALLTGHPVAMHLLVSDLQLEEVKNLMVKAFSSHPPLALMTGTFSQWGITDTTQDGFARGHMYSILGFDQSGPDGGTVTLRNPWGEGNGTGGTIKISLKEYMANFLFLFEER